MPQHPFTNVELMLVHHAGRERTWDRGETLLPEGSLPDEVILVETGLVKVARQAPNGYTSVLAVRGPGDLLGELSCLDGRPRSATAVAMRPVTGVSVPAGRFLRLLEEHGALALAVLRSVAARLRDSDRLRADQGAYGSGIRVARVLLDMALAHGVPVADRPGALAVVVNQHELAGAAGTSRESVVRTLRVLQQDELVLVARGRLLVTDPERLARWGAG
ncbi:Crp/Fnr family transcriptional regulator [Streptomyces sp. V4-01]|uniref:Crp/Fnr family transcriptional regulator n=1 Tax=Actinacidiphila polyblastidii TaxID=3110430 RepID=A0ABU7PED6_9ACTN|nr:Crp/Fnr family transcriptional regulator [Streptomyces sp. V4-01]